jgi:hypothetical protein
MLTGYQHFSDVLPTQPVSQKTEEHVALGGLTGAIGLRRRIVETVQPASRPVLLASPQRTANQLGDGDAIEVFLNGHDEKQPETVTSTTSSASSTSSVATSEKKERWFLEFKPQSAPPSFVDEWWKWTTINAIAGNLLFATLNFFTPRALPTVTQTLGGPVTVALGVLMPILFGAIKTAIVMRCRMQSGEAVDTRLAENIRRELETERAKLQRNERNQWIGAWLGNAIPDLVVGILATTGRRELAERMAEIIQPNLGPLIRAAVGYGIATQLATQTPKTIAIPVNKLKFQ